MQWKINDYDFNTERQSLTSKQGNIQLEPLQAKVLAYFCEHQKEIISRETLIKDVWPTTVVTDNTVNRVIAKLRKALGDDSQSPRFIVTHPRQGYMFIAGAETISAKPRWNTRYMYVTGVLLVFAFAYFLFRTPSLLPVITIEPLTRDSAPEYYPAISPDGNYLAFSVLQKQHLTMALKHLRSGEITELATEDTWSGYPAWSSDGSKLAYMANNKQGCSIELLSIKGGELIGQKTVLKCSADNFAKLAFSHDDSILFYSERQSTAEPYQLFKVDLHSGEKTPLPQPTPLYAGHFHFDLHPFENRLLVATPDEQLWLNLYSLDLDSNDYSLMFKLNEYLCCAIWDHKGNGVVMMSENPGYDLMAYSLDGKDARVIYSAGQQVMMPARHSNGHDYLFVEAVNNIDIYVQDSSDKQSLLVSSSAMDTLPAVSPVDNIMAYVSNQSGQAQIWLHDLTSSKSRKLTQFDDHSHYRTLRWSPDGRFIAALSLNAIRLVDTSTGVFRLLLLPQTRMDHLSWQDNNTLTFSAQTAHQGELTWAASSYDVRSDVLRETTSNYIAVIPNRLSNTALGLAEDGKLWLINGTKSSVLPDMMDRRRPGNAIVFVGDSIFYSVFANDVWQLESWDLSSQSRKIVSTSDVPLHFDVKNQHVYLSKVTSINADILRTRH